MKILIVFFCCVTAYFSAIDSAMARGIYWAASPGVQQDMTIQKSDLDGNNTAGVTVGTAGIDTRVLRSNIAVDEVNKHVYWAYSARDYDDDQGEIYINKIHRAKIDLTEAVDTDIVLSGLVMNIAVDGEHNQIYYLEGTNDGSGLILLKRTSISSLCSATPEIIGRFDEVSMIGNMAFDLARHHIYVNSYNYATGYNIQRVNFDGSRRVDLARDIGGYGFSVDLFRGHIYFNVRGIGGTSNLIRRINLGGKNPVDLIDETGREDIQHISVDPLNGYIYWSQRGGGFTDYVSRARLNGGDVEELFSSDPSGWIRSISSDPSGDDIIVERGGNIQAALNQAKPGDRVLVEPGHYKLATLSASLRNGLRVKTGVSLIGNPDNPETTILNAKGLQSGVIFRGAIGAKLEGFLIKKAERIGVKVIGSQGVLIKNNLISDNRVGLVSRRSSQTLSDNLIKWNRRFQVFVR